MTNTLGAVTRYVIDSSGNRKAEIDPRGGVTRYEYDAAGRQLRKVDALGTVVSNTLDGAGRVNSESITVTGPDGPTTRTTTLNLDKNGRTRSAVNPVGAKLEFGYDASGFNTS